MLAKPKHVPDFFLPLNVIIIKFMIITLMVKKFLAYEKKNLYEINKIWRYTNTVVSVLIKPIGGHNPGF